MESPYIATEQLGNNRDNQQNPFDMANLKTVSSDPHVAALLKKAGFRSVKDLLVRGALGISESTGLNIRRSISICNSARIMLEEKDVLKRCLLCASGFCKCYYNTERISTGSKALDEILGGGIEINSITQIFGQYSSGKTQLCHTISVMVQLDKSTSEELNGQALYIDTQGTFRPERIVEIALARGLNPQNCLKNVIVARAKNSIEQENILENVGSVIDRSRNVKLIIVDSLISNYRAEFIGRGKLPKRQQRFLRYMLMLQRIAQIYQAAIVITNQINSSTSSTARPAGGHILEYPCSYRIYLKQYDRDKRLARIVDSPFQFADGSEASFVISRQGVSDP
jgi:DNA repair protein RadA